MSRHNLLCHGTTYFLTAQLTFSRHNLLSHGTIYFLAAQFTFSRHNLLSSWHNLLSHGTTYFLTAKLFFLYQILLFLLVAAQFTFSRHNLLSHGGGQFSRRQFSSAGNQDKRTQSPLSRVPRQNRFHFPSWLPTMKMRCKYELFIFSLSYSNILKRLLLACI